MSANNLLYIKESKNGKSYSLSMRDIETASHLGKEHRFKTLREAIKKANEILDNEIVEYGLQIDLTTDEK